MIGWLIIACEIGFWIFVAAGLVTRYILKRQRLSTILLILTPVVDCILLIATVIDLKNGAVASTVHGIAAIYIGVSVAYGHTMIKWADQQFAFHFANGERPAKKKKYGKELAKRERVGWYRHLAAWCIGSLCLGGIILYINDTAQTFVLLGTLRLWSLILLIDFIISFSYTVFPKKEKNSYT
ncbi:MULTISPECIES: hypothetical protein [Virgibacillus]|uniref:2TM domain-containing protein n=2 Tax=Virgibacillus TaxID=84406 RepID=A0A024QER4_9BACI|nr:MULTISPECIES: hypothetical protein [Virgibacillus]EQB38892.1 hypothetical protein M948_00685 [Virgibacillus sp. CM-4]MYL43259.1 hypothetical protein [Virgibacillus massiliensis]GGJ66924.1 putative membrane protein YmcC [Virgibacillus kapii]CDQ41018.1 hypothetical protein BN990_03368 [Virgibacillus massiliensis]